MTNLNQLKTVIDQTVNNIPDGPDHITLIKNNVGEYVATPQTVYYENVVGNSSLDAKRKTVDENFANINSPNVGRFVNTRILQDNDENFNRQYIETRLKNCQNLEVLYLIKHEELLTTFAFALNLFDKYKYAVKVILFLLKNLATKPQQRDIDNHRNYSGHNYIPERITIPQPLIKNIKKLVEDQQKVQKIITKMKETIVEGKQQINDNNPEPNVHNARLRQFLNTDQPPVIPSAEMNNNIDEIN